MLNLDTHILLHALSGQLLPKERKLLQADAWGISAIALWEISKLAELWCIDVDLDDAGLTRALSRVHVWPITWEICKTRRTLDFRGDPADQLIAATSIVHRVPLVTRDKVLRKSRKLSLAL